MIDVSQITASTRALEDAMHKKNNPAEYMADRLMTLIQRQEQMMSEDNELGVLVAGSNTAFHLRSIRPSNPDMLIFTGIDANGNGVQLIQHHTQAAVMLVSVPKIEEKPFRMGFTS